MYRPGWLTCLPKGLRRCTVCTTSGPSVQHVAHGKTTAEKSIRHQAAKVGMSQKAPHNSPSRLSQSSPQAQASWFCASTTRRVARDSVCARAFGSSATCTSADVKTPEGPQTQNPELFGSKHQDPESLSSRCWNRMFSPIQSPAHCCRASGILQRFRAQGSHCLGPCTLAK